MTHALTTTTTTNQPDMLAMCASVARSGIGGIKTAEQAFALTAIALAEDTQAGDSPVAFLRALGRAQRDYHLLNGRPAMKAETMLSRFQAAGGKVAWGEYSDKRCEATFAHPQGGTITIEWTIDRAKAAGLVRAGPWTAHPRAMLRSRVISEAIRTVFPGVLGGAYTPDEAEEVGMPDVAPVVQIQATATQDAQHAKDEARRLYAEIAATDAQVAKDLKSQANGDPTAFISLAKEHLTPVVIDDEPKESNHA